MFRAITGYFFGGAAEEPQSTLETQEVNDWLVVNMTDRPQDDIVMIESIKPDPMSESEYEDILDAVSCLMRPVEEPEPELEPSDGESTMDTSSEDEEEEEEEKEDNILSRPPSSSSFGRSFPFSSRWIGGNDFDPMELFAMHVGRDEQMVVCEEFLSYPRTMNLVEEQEVVELFFLPPSQKDVFPACYILDELLHMHSSNHGSVVMESPCSPDKKVSRDLVHSKKWISAPSKVRIPYEQAPEHTTPYNIKQEIKQRINELKQEQKSDKYRNQKLITKGQLNRQNKNYQFQTSCKKNRRRNLQRTPSGANNNRKCSC